MFKPKAAYDFWLWLLFKPFFFQAEDGIRDLTVTGVQTCALPISAAAGGDRAARGGLRVCEVPRACDAALDDALVRGRDPGRRPDPLHPGPGLRRPPAEIGRASCRERV